MITARFTPASRIFTDAEAPMVLTEAIQVRSTYAAIMADLESAEIRVHAFTPAELDYIEQNSWLLFLR